MAKTYPYQPILNPPLTSVAMPQASLPQLSSAPLLSNINPAPSIVADNNTAAGLASQLGFNTDILKSAYQPLNLGFDDPMDATGLGKQPLISLGAGDNTPDASTSWLSSFGEWAGQNTELMKLGVDSVLGLAGFINGNKALKQNKQQFNAQMDFANKNYEASRKTTNSQLADRQARRVAESPDKSMSVNDYMKLYGV